MTRRMGVLVAALAAMCAGPGHAAGLHSGGFVGGLPRPVIGREPGDVDDAAFTCTMATVADATGQVTENPYTMIGPVTGGPWASLDPNVTSITITCMVQTNSDDPEAEESSIVRRTLRTSTMQGNIGLLADTVSYDRAPADDVFLCTMVSWTGVDSGGSWQYDANTSTERIECPQATSIEL